MNRKFYKRVSIGPHMTFSKSATLRMLFFLLALFPQIILLFTTRTYSSITIIACAIAGALCSRMWNFLKREKVFFSALYSILTGTLIGFFLPASYPPIAVFFITLTFMTSVSLFFGGQGVSWVNPVVLTVAAAWFIGHFNFPGFEIFGDDLFFKNPSLSLIQNSFAENRVDERLTVFLNESVFALFSVSIPEGYVSVFWDNFSQIPAFRFNALTLLASVFLIAFDLENGMIPIVYILVYSIFVKFLSPVMTGGVPFSGDLLLALLSSGTLFTAFFILQWDGTVPYTKQGKLLYAACGGIFAFVFCVTGTSPVGSMMAILFLNLLAPMIQVYENHRAKKKVAFLLTQEKIDER